MLGDKLKELREERGLYQKDIAEYIGVTSRAVGHYETNERIPPLDILNKLADFYSVSTDYLLGRTDVKNKTVQHKSKIDIISADIQSLSPENQKEIEKIIELYKMKEMQERNIKNKNNINGTER